MKKIALLLCIPALVACSGDIEKPDYQVLHKKEAYELRKYDDLAVVTAPMKSMNGRNDSFGNLFEYISGENEKKQKIDMTSPVFMDEGKNTTNREGTMSFVLPKEVVKGKAPSPNADKLQLDTIKGGTYAVLNFKGWRDEKKQQQASAALVKWAKSMGWKPVGSTFYAFYNPPWTPELMRRNEVWIKIDPTSVKNPAE